jgi:hypothetical protein
VVIFTGDNGDLVPGAGMVDPLVVGLGSEAFDVERGKDVAGAVHSPPAVAAADYGDELSGLLVIVSRDELDQRLLRGSAAEKGDYVLSVASPLVLADRLAKSDLDRAFCARCADEHAVAGIAIATARPSVGLSVPLVHQAPIRRQSPGRSAVRRRTSASPLSEAPSASTSLMIGLSKPLCASCVSSAPSSDRELSAR